MSRSEKTTEIIVPLSSEKAEKSEIFDPLGEHVTPKKTTRTSNESLKKLLETPSTSKELTSEVPVKPVTISSITSPTPIKPIGEKIVATPIINETNIDNILKKISAHLLEIQTIDDYDFGKINKKELLNILRDKEKRGEKDIIPEIDRECFLHYLSLDKNFLPEKQTQCSNIINKYSKSGKLDLNTLLELSKNNNFYEDSEFYRNLYNFNIALVDFIANDSRFKNANITIQTNILSNLHEFIKQSLVYLNSFMNRYTIINDRLIKSSYNLLYLLNLITYKHISTGRNIDELTRIYNDMYETIKTNIRIYDSIKKDNSIKGVSSLKDDQAEKIQYLIDELNKRLPILKSQQEKLKTEVAEINKNFNNLEGLASTDVTDIVKELKSQIENIEKKEGKNTASKNKQ